LRPVLTILTLVHNEEEMLPSCLQSLAALREKAPTELLVVDSFSADRTREIACSAGARVLQHEFADYSSQYNWGMEQSLGEWILILDADETLDVRLADSICTVILAPLPEFEIYRLVRNSFFLDRRMRSTAWSGECLPRLFRKGVLSYSGQVHSRLDLGGRPVGLLEGRLLHHTCRTLDRFFAKNRRYAVLWAEDAFMKGKGASLARSFASAGWRFLNDYFLRRGFLDGSRGFLASVLCAVYTFEKYARLWDMRRKRETVENRDRQ
jgi:glycosyltransferase involved in cell wall biosynthesis